MTRAQLRARMRRQRQSLRESLVHLRRQARARVEAHPAVQRERRRRRLRRALGVLALLLLAALVRCDCQAGPERPPPKPVVVAPPAPEVKVKKPAVPPVKRKPLEARLESQPRGDFRGEVRPAPSWLDAFRLQVAARSPRLAQCFTGSERPGALRWTSAVNPRSGAVSDHELEPLGASTHLTTEQRACVLRVLSAPSYRLEVTQAAALPDRVGLVIEF